jgi:hypothetical protein
MLIKLKKAISIQDKQRKRSNQMMYLRLILLMHLNTMMTIIISVSKSMIMIMSSNIIKFVQMINIITTDKKSMITMPAKKRMAKAVDAVAMMKGLLRN